MLVGRFTLTDNEKYKGKYIFDHLVEFLGFYIMFNGRLKRITGRCYENEMKIW